MRDLLPSGSHITMDGWVCDGSFLTSGLSPTERDRTHDVARFRVNSTTDHVTKSRV